MFLVPVLLTKQHWNVKSLLRYLLLVDRIGAFSVLIWSRLQADKAILKGANEDDQRRLDKAVAEKECARQLFLPVPLPMLSRNQ